jgi:hypothetical protein
VEKIYRYILLGIVVVLLTGFGLFAINSNRNMGELRLALRASEERADLATAKSDASAAILESIDRNITAAQTAVGRAISSSGKLKIILDAIQAISIELRKGFISQQSLERYSINR